MRNGDIGRVLCSTAGVCLFTEMVLVSEERSPLLSTTERRSFRRPLILSAVLIAAVVTLSSTFYHLRGSVLEEQYDLPDGVQPVDKLAFTQAMKVHEMGAKKLDDVASRENLNSYFDQIGDEYKKESEEQRLIRADRHPGQIHHPSVVEAFVKNMKAFGAKKSKAERVKEDIAQESASVQRAVGKGLEESHDSSFSIKLPSLNKAMGQAVQQSTAAVEAPAPSQSASKQAAMTILAGSKVKLEFYMESMCPGCKYFTTNVLADVMNKPGFLDIVELKVYPYGNGKLTGTNIQCQHGSDECEGNKIIACMQSLYPVTGISLGFLPTFKCMEKGTGLPSDEAQSCATANGLDYAKVKQCATTAEGDQLALEAAQATENLSPPHEYAPWLTLNGLPLRDKAYDLKEEVCKAYTGNKAGTMCEEPAAKKASIQALAAAVHPPVCYPTAILPQAAARAATRLAAHGPNPALARRPHRVHPTAAVAHTAVKVPTAAVESPRGTVARRLSARKHAQAQPLPEVRRRAPAARGRRPAPARKTGARPNKK